MFLQGLVAGDVSGSGVLEPDWSCTVKSDVDIGYHDYLARSCIPFGIASVLGCSPVEVLIYGAIAQGR
jgi:hypothetical protein